MAHNDRPGDDQKLPLAAATVSPKRNETLVQCFVVCAHLSLLILLYGQTATFDYVYFDDADYVLENAAVRAGLTAQSMQWAFTSFYMSNWHPLSWLSHMLDVSLFGTDPGWAHLHNMALHGINSLLVYVLLLKLCGSCWKACALSLVFLVHPLHVESVAWIAERKDLLCALFFLLGLLLYDSYRALPGRLRYAAVLIAYILALLSKPMAVTFPLVLLILDFFVYRKHFQNNPATGRDKRFDYFKSLAEKAPLLALSVASSAITIVAQDSGNSLAYLEAHSLASRWWTATNAYVIYLKQWLLPVDLVAFYPISETTALVGLVLPSAILLGLMFLALLYAPAFPLLAAGPGWYLVTLLPVIGLIQVGSQAHADRYMYLPSIGVLIPCIYLLPSARSEYARLASVLWVIVILYFSMISYWQIGYWKNEHVLFSRVDDVVGPTHKGNIHLAQDYIRRGMLAEAKQHSLAAMKLHPERPDAYQALGNIALAEQAFSEAQAFYQQALAKGPASASVVNNIGITLAEQGNIEAGIKAFEKALEIEPTLDEAQKNLKLYSAKLQRQLAP